MPAPWPRPASPSIGRARRHPGPAHASTTLPQRNSTAWGPLTFGSPVVALQSGYRGQLQFVDPLGNVLYMYWGVTNVTYQVKISGPLGPGDTQVCGTVTAPAGLSLPGEVDIHDLTNNPTDIMIGTGSIGRSGLILRAGQPAVVSQAGRGGLRRQLLEPAGGRLGPAVPAALEPAAIAGGGNGYSPHMQGRSRLRTQR